MHFQQFKACIIHLFILFHDTCTYLTFTTDNVLRDVVNILNSIILYYMIFLQFRIFNLCFII